MISHRYCTLKTSSCVCVCVFPAQVDVESIKWISCKGMYKGYRSIPLHAHRGDPAIQFYSVSSHFFRKKNLISLSHKTDLRESIFPKEKGSGCSSHCTLLSRLYLCFSSCHILFYSSLFTCHLYDQLLSLFTSAWLHLFSSGCCGPESTLTETLTVWLSITLTADLNSPPPQ